MFGQYYYHIFLLTADTEAAILQDQKKQGLILLLAVCSISVQHVVKV